MGHRIILACIVLGFSICGYSADAPDGDTWANLNNISKHRSLTFIGHDHSCEHGRIVSVGSDSITIRLWDTPKHQVTHLLKRSDILRVTDGGHTNDVLYSARSSWSDVRQIPLNSKETAVVINNSGTHYNGKVKSTSDRELTIEQAGKDVTLLKSAIARVYYVRFKPMTDSAKYSAQEAGFLDPELWWYMLNLEGKVPVLLYDSSVQENNGPVACKRP